MSATSYKNKAAIIADLWLTYRDDEQFANFFKFADLGIPLAYSITNDIVKSTPKAKKLIEEAFDYLLDGFGISDLGFESLDDMLGTSDDLDIDE